MTVVATNEVVPCEPISEETAFRASSVPSITSCPPAPWICTSIKPGAAILSVAMISCSARGQVRELRGPTASITPSRIRIPASGNSVVGVNARPTCRRVVDMVKHHRSGNSGQGAKKNGQDRTLPMSTKT